MGKQGTSLPRVVLSYLLNLKVWILSHPTMIKNKMNKVWQFECWQSVNNITEKTGLKV